MSNYSIDIDALTIIHTDDAGEDHDLNAEGEQCSTTDELWELVGELFRQGCYNIEVRDTLREDITVARSQTVTASVYYDDESDADNPGWVVRFRFPNGEEIGSVPPSAVVNEPDQDADRDELERYIAECAEWEGVERYEIVTAL